MKNNVKAWQMSLQSAMTDPKALLDLLNLDRSLLKPALAASHTFSFKVPLEFVERMKKGDPNDPLLLQVLPLHSELADVPGYWTDPLEEGRYNPLPGLLHKYPGRVLLTFTGNCAINCRYCFRRHFPYENNNPGTRGWQKALDYVSKDSSIKEVILSGGDPLLVNDQVLQALREQIQTISHVQRFRIHSRIPVVLPNRITPELLAAISGSSLKTILVVHINHPQEIDASVAESTRALLAKGITLLNQTVLLRKINDDLETLIELSEKLMSIGILPYYLHILDKVQGAAHFDLPLEKAQALHRQLTERLSGYLVPKLVKEISGSLSKVHI